jgi:predicted DNA-binding ribbon-helix-helix protein
MAKFRPQKHSLTLNGHRTSVSLEPEFWKEFIQIAQEENLAINALASKIDEQRGADIGLASAMRLYILAHLKSKIGRAEQSEA